MHAPAPLNLRNLDEGGLGAAVIPYGVPQGMVRRVFTAVHRDYAAGLERAGLRGLPLAVLRALDRDLVWPELQIVERRRAEDGFVKYLFQLHDGARVEAVRIPLPDPEAARELRERRRAGRAAPLEALPTAKYTLCISSQAGCALACDFCSTGRMGAIRSLEIWEILAQVHLIAAEAEHPIRGVVFMGMGEPFLNYDNVIGAAKILSHPAGRAIGSKAISISTAGVVPAIHRFAAERHRFRLIVSLGAPNSDERRRLMPIEDRWPLPELMHAVRAYAATTTQRITIAYVTVGGPQGNMTPAHARQLVDLLAGLKVRLNLIEVTDAVGRHPTPTPDELATFRAALEALGAPVVRRYSGGKEIAAACGTLSAGAPPSEVATTRTLRRASS